MTRRSKQRAPATPPPTPEALRVAMRAYVHRHDDAGPGTGSNYSNWKDWPLFVLVVDTETTTDERQRLLYGVYRVARCVAGAPLQTFAEGLIYANDLPTFDPTGFARLQAYAASHRAHVTRGEDTTLAVLSRDQFVDTVFWPTARLRRGLIVGFNLPFDLTRLALGASIARRGRDRQTGQRSSRFAGGFSLLYSQFRHKATGELTPSQYDPRIWLKSIDSKRSFMQFAGARELSDHGFDEFRDEVGQVQRRPVFSGHFLDLRTLAFSLTNESYDLRRAAKAFGTKHEKGTTDDLGGITDESLAYARRDVLVTAELFDKLREEFDRHPVDIAPTKVYSPATLGKAYLRTMGVTPPPIKFATLPRELLGIASMSYFGGRTEARIVRTPVPVVYTDFMSMYPTVNALLGTWDIVTAARLDLEDCTSEAQAMLARVTTDKCLDPVLWKSLCFFAEIEPEADILPVRARYNANRQGLNIGLNFLTAFPGCWYAAPDLVASVLLNGKTPTIRRALRLRPRGKQDGLRAVNFGGNLTIDPVTEDFFKRVIELRKAPKPDVSATDAARIEAWLKVLANSSGYGVFAEMNPEELPAGETVPVAVYGRRVFDAVTNAPEKPGVFSFMPLASLTTAAARLMLAILERLVTDRGGAYAFCDTDSMAIVATQDGGEVEGVEGRRALSWQEVRELADEMARLNPYDRGIIGGSILKVEDVNFNRNGQQREVYAYAIASKRYALYTRGPDDEINILEASEHGLGHLIDPINTRRDDKKRTRLWIADAWENIVREALALPEKPIPYLDLPALSRITVSSPHVAKAFAEWNAGKAYDDQVKPSNFVLSAIIDAFGHPPPLTKDDARSFHLVRPFTKDIASTVDLPWIEVYSGKEYMISTTFPAPADRVGVQTFRTVLARHKNHVEAKSAPMHPAPHREPPRGLLRRRHVDAAESFYIGKEANRLEDVQSGLVHDEREILNVFLDPADDPWVTRILPQLRKIPTKELARAAEISARAVRMLKTEKIRPSRQVRDRLVAFLAGSGE